MGLRVLVTGGSGLVGQGVAAAAAARDDVEWILWSSRDCDLEGPVQAVTGCIKAVAPTVVLHLAACVGGLFRNQTHKVEMLERNLRINTTVLRACHSAGVQRVVSLLSTCIFPNKASYPIAESHLHMGPPHPSNQGYAYAKRMLDVQSEAYRCEYGRDYVCVIPTNVYGPHDNFDLTDGHVIPALIHKCHLARKHGTPFVVSGSGTPLRQFIHSADLGDIIVRFGLHGAQTDTAPAKWPRLPARLIAAPDADSEVPILTVVDAIVHAFGYLGILPVFDMNADHDGQHRKTVDNTALRTMFPDLNLRPVRTGIEETVQWFIAAAAAHRANPASAPRLRGVTDF